MIFLSDLLFLTYFTYLSIVLFSCSVVSDSENPWTIAHQSSLSFSVSQSLLKLMCIESVTSVSLNLPSVEYG